MLRSEGLNGNFQFRLGRGEAPGSNVIDSGHEEYRSRSRET